MSSVPTKPTRVEDLSFKCLTWLVFLNIWLWGRLSISGWWKLKMFFRVWRYVRETRSPFYSWWVESIQRAPRRYLEVHEGYFQAGYEIYMQSTGRFSGFLFQVMPEVHGECLQMKVIYRTLSARGSSVVRGWVIGFNMVTSLQVDLYTTWITMIPILVVIASHLANEIISGTLLSIPGKSVKTDLRNKCTDELYNIPSCQNNWLWDLIVNTAGV